MHDVYNFKTTQYGKTPLMRIIWDDGPSGYAENPDNWIFSLKIAYISSLKWKKVSTKDDGPSGYAENPGNWIFL